MVLIFSSLVAFVALIHMLINETIFDNFGDQYTFVPSVYLYIPAFISYGCGFYFYSSRYIHQYIGVLSERNLANSISAGIVINSGMSWSYWACFSPIAGI